MNYNYGLFVKEYKFDPDLISAFRFINRCVTKKLHITRTDPIWTFDKFI